MVAAGLAVTVVDALSHPSRLPFDAVGLALMALASTTLAPSHAPGRRFVLGYGMVFVVLLLPTRLWAACTLFQNRWGTRTLRAET